MCEHEIAVDKRLNHLGNRYFFSIFREFTSKTEGIKYDRRMFKMWRYSKHVKRVRCNTALVQWILRLKIVLPTTIVSQNLKHRNNFKIKLYAQLPLNYSTNDINYWLPYLWSVVQSSLFSLSACTLQHFRVETLVVGGQNISFRFMSFCEFFYKGYWKNKGKVIDKRLNFGKTQE